MPPSQRNRQGPRSGGPKLCPHDALLFEPSSHAAVVGYEQLSAGVRCSAASGNSSSYHEALPSLPKWRCEDFGTSSGIFPAPVVLPYDELAWHPVHSRQDLVVWKSARYRNAVTPGRKTLYVAAEPLVDESVSAMRSWSAESVSAIVAKPSLEDVMEYLAAFYHGLEVRQLPVDWSFTQWSSKPSRRVAAFSPTAVGLANRTAGDVTRIRVRKTKDKDRRLSHQMNLNDLLDVAGNVLPGDAYALLMLTSYDLYEDESDDFCCGRAYGGSRIAVVSSARYHPGLDAAQSVDREHFWPASHCASYVGQQCGIQQMEPTPVQVLTTPLQCALDAFKAAYTSNYSGDKAYGTWLARTVRTAAHELGHCFGMGHCTYYACVMQGTASLVEDVRQPPDLCPIDLAKVIYATRLTLAPRMAINVAIAERYQALHRVCGKYRGIELFDAFAAWLKAVLELMSAEPVTIEID